MRKGLFSLVSAWLLVAGLAPPAEAQYVYEDRGVRLLFWDESDRDGEAKGWIELCDLNSGAHAWAWFRLDAHSGDVEVRDEWGELVGAVSSAYGWGHQRPGQRFYDGIDCWDHPAQNERFGHLTREIMRDVARGSLRNAVACWLSGASFGLCVAGGAAGELISRWLWDIGAYLYTCYGYR